LAKSRSSSSALERCKSFSLLLVHYHGKTVCCLSACCVLLWCEASARVRPSIARDIRPIVQAVPPHAARDAPKRASTRYLSVERGPVHDVMPPTDCSCGSFRGADDNVVCRYPPVMARVALRWLVWLHPCQSGTQTTRPDTAPGYSQHSAPRLCWGSATACTARARELPSSSIIQSSSSRLLTQVYNNDLPKRSTCSFVSERLYITCNILASGIRSIVSQVTCIIPWRLFAFA
jgi:hypothetical protein